MLPGKLQTDKLENRFSRYRQLSGGNYHISYIQIIESEKKLRTKSILGLHSAKYGQVAFSFDALTVVADYVINNSTIDDYTVFSKIVNHNFIDIVDIDNPALIYICGYAAFKIKHRLHCKLCCEFVESKNYDTCNIYFLDLNRGNLTIPSDTIILIGQHIYGIMQYLISNEYENAFLSVTHQQQLLLKLVAESLNRNNLTANILNDTCICGHTHAQIVLDILKCMANILLNNYRKCRTNHYLEKINTKKRKLQTLL